MDRNPAVLHLPMQVIGHMRFNPVVSPRPKFRLMQIHNHNPRIENLCVSGLSLRTEIIFPIASQNEKPNNERESRNDRHYRKFSSRCWYFFRSYLRLAHNIIETGTILPIST